jgi:two-component system cell cycle sensor histidine kinase/response regulator CckA
LLKLSRNNGEIRQKEAKAMEGSKGRVKEILVAEDEEGMRDLMVDVLESAGFSVIAVTNGAEAIESFIERKEEIGLVILDMVMPVLNGVETFRELKKKGLNVPLLLSSGYDKVEEKLIGEGVAGFIGKPYRIEDLLEKVRTILEIPGDSQPEIPGTA